MEARPQLLRSNWWRTALWAVGPVVLAAGLIVFFVVRWTGSESTASNNSGPLPAMPEAPADPKVDQTIPKEAREVAGKFILTAVARKNTGASWELLDPAYPGKGDFTKASWAKGDIPVIPFPVTSMAETRFRVEWRSGKQLSLEVLLIPKEGDETVPQAFILGLTQRGPRWLVDYWATSYTPPVRAIPE